MNSSIQQLWQPPPQAFESYTLLYCLVLPMLYMCITFFFLISDLDDTLYPYSSGVSVQIAKNIDGNEFTRVPLFEC